MFKKMLIKGIFKRKLAGKLVKYTGGFVTIGLLSFIWAKMDGKRFDLGNWVEEYWLWIIGGMIVLDIVITLVKKFAKKA